MSSSINGLVSMHDIQGLFEVLNESEDWMEQMDAAEGLVKLGDRRGLEYLMIASQSEEREVCQAAEEILQSPDVQGMREQIEAEARYAHQKHLETARLRLQKGKKVFLHKVIYLPADEVLREDLTGEGFHIPDLDDAGLEGWEVVNILPRRRQLLVGSVDDHFTGAYVFLKKEVGLDDVDELEKS